MTPATSPSPDRSLGAAEAAAALAAGRVTARALVETCLARIAAHDETLHAFARVDADAALRTADRADADRRAGRIRGPLHGVPFAVKDNYDVAGLPTRANSRLTEAAPPAATDSAVVARLRAGGAICLGKLATWEYGTGNGGEAWDLPGPTTRNPWDLARFAGGSSTGAGAAVVAGMLPVAFGSDTTGSVRLPAAATGAVGLKPTQGAIPRQGILPNCYSLDVLGPLGRRVADVAIAFEAVAEPRAPAPRGSGVAGLRIGVFADHGPGMVGPGPAMTAAFEAALRCLEARGARLVPLSYPVPCAEALAVAGTIGQAESAAIHEADLIERPDVMGFALRDKLLAGSMIRAVDYLAAQRARRLIGAALDAVLRSVDVAVGYGAHHVAPRLGVEPEMTAFTRDTALTPFNLSGHPALIQPTGMDSGLPLHWQLSARHHAEAMLFRVAETVEAALVSPQEA